MREGGSKDAFVKTMESVQGEARDVILVSVGYEPSAPRGRPTMIFDPGEMDLSKTKLEWPRVLKRFLDYAKTGIIDERVATDAEPDTPFEADIATEIRKLGFLVDHQVGTVGFKIDLGVRHPDRLGTYILAVECDGATYHSAPWARERDRLRQEVLEHLGWKFHRIWSTDWFYRRTAELERLRAALDEAFRVSEAGLKVPGANNGGKQEAVVASQAAPVEPISLIEARQRTMPPYQKAWVSMKTHLGSGPIKMLA